METINQKNLPHSSPYERKLNLRSVRLSHNNSDIFFKILRDLKKTPKTLDKVYLSFYEFYTYNNYFFKFSKVYFRSIGLEASSFRDFFYKQLTPLKIRSSGYDIKDPFRSKYGTLSSEIHYRSKLIKINSYKMFRYNSEVVNYSLFSAFYYNFCVLAFKEMGFSKETLAVNFQNKYFDYSEVLNFFTLPSWVAVRRYWHMKLLSIKGVVIIAGDNHLINHMDKTKYFIVDFISGTYYLSRNSVTAYIDVYDEFFSTVFIGFVYRYKMVGMQMRFYLYLSFYKKLKLMIK